MELINSNSKYIYSPVKWTNYDALHDRISKAVAHLPLRFAKRHIALDTISWHIDSDSSAGWSTLREASPEERSAVGEVLAAGRSAVQQSLSGEADANAYTDQVFTQPDAEDFVNFRSLPDGSVEVALAGWGYRPTGRPGGAMHWRIPVRPKRLSVQVGFRLAGQPLPEEPFGIAALHGENKLVTDAEGLYAMPPLSVGDSRTLTCRNQSFSLTVSPAAPLVWFDLAEEDGTPEEKKDEDEVLPPLPPADSELYLLVNPATPHLSLTVKQGNQSYVGTTDERGCMRLPDMMPGDTFTAGLMGVPDACEAAYRIQEGQQYYEFILPPPPPLPRPLSLRVIDVNDAPLSGARLTFRDSGGRSSVGVTDANGSLSLPAEQFPPNVPVQIAIEVPGRHIEPTTLTPLPDEFDYVLRVYPKKGFSWWRLVCILLMVLLVLLGLWALLLCADANGWWGSPYDVLRKDFNPFL